MIYLTGDKHRCFSDIKDFCDKVGTTKDDLLIILGDAGINYKGRSSDMWLKHKLEKLPIRLLCIHGNHEMRPETITGYKQVPFYGGMAYWEDYYPSLFFAKDGEVYNFDGKQAIILGGACSVDKEILIATNEGWWADEQPSDKIKAYVAESLDILGNKVDYVLSHTCPERYTPMEMFLAYVDQSTVDKSTELWLGDIESKLNYERWYCGHWHTDKRIDNLRFLYNDFIELGK